MNTVPTKPLRVTTKERMCQPLSAALSTLSVLEKVLERKGILNDNAGIRIAPETTITSLIESTKESINRALDQNNDTYWDTIEYPGGENGFPYKGQNL